MEESFQRAAGRSAGEGFRNNMIIYATMTPALIAIIVFGEIANASAPTKLMVAVATVFSRVGIWINFYDRNERMDASEQGYDTPTALIGIRQGLPESAMGSFPRLCVGGHGCWLNHVAAGNLPVSKDTRRCHQSPDANIAREKANFA